MLQERTDSFVVMIQRLEAIKVNGDPMAGIRAIREQCDKAFLPFAESEIEFIDREHMEEADDHILRLHEGAFTLRAQCDSLLSSTTLKDSEFSSAAPKIRDTFLDCCARIENIYSLRRPALLSAVDAVL